MKLSFPQSEHLKNNREFKQVMQSSIMLKLPQAKLYGEKLEADAVSKIGLIVGKKTGHAPMRNRIKRLWKEAFRLERNSFLTPMNLVVRVYPSYQPAPLEDLRASIAKLQSCCVESA